MAKCVGLLYPCSVKKSFKIPKYVTLGAHRIKIKYVKNLHKKKSAVGMAYFNENEIWIQANTKQFPSAPSQQKQWYYHELFHHMLFLSGFHKLNEDEDFVDLISQYQTQASETEEY